MVEVIIALVAVATVIAIGLFVVSRQRAEQRRADRRSEAAGTRDLARTHELKAQEQAAEADERAARARREEAAAEQQKRAAHESRSVAQALQSRADDIDPDIEIEPDTEERAVYPRD